MARILEHGFAQVPGVLRPAELQCLAEALDRLPPGPGFRARGGAVYATRSLFQAAPEMRALAGSAALRALVEPLLGPAAFPVRALLFDKQPGANWKVPWHQDRTIAVRERLAVDGFGPWSVKSGVVHVQPPPAVLERMLAVRLHLGPCGPDDGPLQVLPGSHGHGRLSAAEIGAWRARARPFTCVAEAGDALLMRPLLLHASGAAVQPRGRRVIHLEYACEPLPGGLEWDVAPSS